MRIHNNDENMTTDPGTADDTATDDDNLSWFAKLKIFSRRHLLLLLVLVGIIAGFVLGFCIRITQPGPDVIMWTGLPGEMFMRMVKVTVLPLITGTLIKGAYSSDVKSSAGMSGLAFCFCLTSNIIGTLVAAGFFFIFKPGSDVVSVEEILNSKPETYRLQSQDLFADLIRNIFPDNVVTATIEKTQTRYVEVPQVSNASNGSTMMTEYRRYVGTAPGTNILGLVVLLTLFGLAAGKLGEQGRTVVYFFHTVFEIFKILLGWLIWYTPIGVTSLIATSIASVADLESTFTSVAMYVLTFTLGSLTEVFVIFPVLYFLVIRRNPFSFLLSLSKIFLIAFSPPGAVIVIPDMIKISEERYKVKSNIAGLVVPICATGCRFGSAFFINLTSLFLMSLDGVSLEYTHVALICVHTTIASFAVPTIPSGSVVAVIVIISSLNINSTFVGVVMAMEWYTDRIRTVINVMGMVFITLMVDRFMGRKTIHDETAAESEDRKTIHDEATADCEDASQLGNCAEVAGNV